ncbi:uncharacterized protein LOC119679887 [Teleopsis dalmanni]|uniref:uncharacterized protein LOC119679887 n=1 Tax=Teleopsis dalmanni TaxID=139649 RepID=UPI0018CD7F66|nr:uncharacterized protein LOC119679887 [Teleopsis dalmanni]
MLILKLVISLIFLRISLVIAGTGGTVNITDFVQHRQKRHLIFQNGGTIKLSLGPSMPVPLDDPVTWRALVCSYNLQGGHYTMPTTPLYPWDKWEHIFSRSLKKIENNIRADNGRDDARLFVYTALENYMSRKNGNGRACLLRSICENAQVDHYVGIFGTILNIVLTPGKQQLNSIYTAASEAGKLGADCVKLYADCPSGANILDGFLHDW